MSQRVCFVLKNNCVFVNLSTILAEKAANVSIVDEQTNKQTFPLVYTYVQKVIQIFFHVYHKTHLFVLVAKTLIDRSFRIME